MLLRTKLVSLGRPPKGLAKTAGKLLPTETENDISLTFLIQKSLGAVLKQTRRPRPKAEKAHHALEQTIASKFMI